MSPIPVFFLERKHKLSNYTYKLYTDRSIDLMIDSDIMWFLRLRAILHIHQPIYIGGVARMVTDFLQTWYMCSSHWLTNKNRSKNYFGILVAMETRHLVFPLKLPILRPKKGHISKRSEGIMAKVWLNDLWF